LKDQRDRTAVVGDDATKFVYAALVANGHGTNSSSDLDELSFHESANRRGAARERGELNVGGEMGVLSHPTARDFVTYRLFFECADRNFAT